MWVNSGKHEGPIGESMHAQGLAVDLVICGMNSAETAKRLREAGFTCSIAYYDKDQQPCHMAHGDLRGTKWAEGAYALGGKKAETCPRRAFSKTVGCGNQSKDQWKYQR